MKISNYWLLAGLVTTAIGTSFAHLLIMRAVGEKASLVNAEGLFGVLLNLVLPIFIAIVVCLFLRTMAYSAVDKPVSSSLGKNHQVRLDNLPPEPVLTGGDSFNRHHEASSKLQHQALSSPRKSVVKSRIKREAALLVINLVLGALLVLIASGFQVIGYYAPNGRYLGTSEEKALALFLTPYLLLISYRLLRKSISIVNHRDDDSAHAVGIDGNEPGSSPEVMSRTTSGNQEYYSSKKSNPPWKSIALGCLILMLMGSVGAVVWKLQGVGKKSPSSNDAYDRFLDSDVIIGQEDKKMKENQGAPTPSSDSTSEEWGPWESVSVAAKEEKEAKQKEENTGDVFDQITQIDDWEEVPIDEKKSTPLYDQMLAEIEDSRLAEEANRKGDEVRTSSYRDAVISQLPEIANNLNKNLPMRIDKATQIDSVIAYNDTMTFIYSLINLNAKDVSQDMKDFLYTQVVNGYCTSMGDMKTFRENNITLKIVYRDINGKIATTFSVDYSSCR